MIRRAATSAQTSAARLTIAAFETTDRDYTGVRLIQQKVQIPYREAWWRKKLDIA